MKVIPSSVVRRLRAGQISAVAPAWHKQRASLEDRRSAAPSRSGEAEASPPVRGWRYLVACAAIAVGKLKKRLGQAQIETSEFVDVEFARPYRMALRTDVWVVCLSGTAWLTSDGSYADTILSQGDALRVSRAEDPLIVGMPRCRVRIVGETEQLADGPPVA